MSHLPTGVTKDGQPLEAVETLVDGASAFDTDRECL